MTLLNLPTLKVPDSKVRLRAAPYQRDKDAHNHHEIDKVGSSGNLSKMLPALDSNLQFGTVNLVGGGRINRGILKHRQDSMGEPR